LPWEVGAWKIQRNMEKTSAHYYNIYFGASKMLSVYTLNGSGNYDDAT
jgi:hypothetical protein